jgi:hypothetical protein
MTPQSTDTLAAALRTLIAPIVAEAVRDALAELAPREAPPALIDTASLCVELGVSRPTVAKLVGEGLPVVHVGDHARYRLAAVIAWLEAREAARGAA